MQRLVIVFIALFLMSGVAFAADLEAGQLAYQAKDFKTAYEELLPLAEEGNDEAQFLVGNLYSDGLHVAQDHSLALEWYEKAGARGNVTAQLAAGTSYLEGLGTDKNPIKAVPWFEKAAGQDNELGQVLLGLLYLEGKGTEQDKVKAYQWFVLAGRESGTGNNWAILGKSLADEVKNQLGPEQILKAEAFVTNWKPEGKQSSPKE